MTIPRSSIVWSHVAGDPWKLWVASASSSPYEHHIPWKTWHTDHTIVLDFPSNLGKSILGTGIKRVNCKCSKPGNVRAEGSVAKPPELFRLKCASHCYTTDTNSMHFKRNNPLVCRVSARCNHGLTRSKQVYLARRRVYNRITAHQLLIHRILNIITNRFKLKYTYTNIV
jgi:hypothetical protein